MPDASWFAAASMRRGRDEQREMLSSLASLYVRGAPVRWEAVVAGLHGRRISLPTYPFQRERYWVDTPGGKRPAAVPGHPLLGEGHALAAIPGTHIWERDISLETHPWLADHRVQGAAIVPATAYIEMALAAAGEMPGSGSVVVREIQNLKPIILHEGSAHRIQATLSIDSDGGAQFTVYGRRSTASADTPWIRHMAAHLARVEYADTGAGRERFEAIKRDSEDTLSGEQFYAQLGNKGNQWGVAFQGMREVWRRVGEALGRIEVPTALRGELPAYRFHPAVSDSCGHALVATLPLEATTGPRGGAFVVGVLERFGSIGPQPGPRSGRTRSYASAVTTIVMS